MKEKKVNDIYGREIVINEEKRKLRSFSNKNGVICWNAPIVEDGKETVFWTDFEEKGKISSVREKLNAWNNKILLLYASAVNFDAGKNDPDGARFEKVVKYVENHQNVFFTKTGDFRKRLLVSEKEIKKIID